LVSLQKDTDGVGMASYILFDTETTGNQTHDRIIQVGAMIFHSKSNIEIVDELCSSPQEISIEAMEVHNITPEIIASKPPYGQTVFSQKIETLNTEENYLIAHNIGFDLGMIEKEGFKNSYTLIDTVRCARHLYPKMPYHRLQYLRYALGLYKNEQEEAEKFGIALKAHDAIGDVLILKLLLGKLTQKCKELFPDEKIMEKLAELTNTPVLLQTFRFGKYKDREIGQIAREDAGYLKWMRNNLELDEDLTYTLDHYLEQF
jgi:DNA polymerase III epsilon subunit-like protein